MLGSTEKRLQKNKPLLETYKEQIQDMVQRGVARKLTQVEIENYDGPVYYLSHHEVLKPESTSTPCRIVFNSSAKFQGHSLNNYWAKGPDLMNNLLGILVRFREGPVAFVGDIRKMYHAIKIS
ncbi:RNA-directed DNA polymerase from transposon BS, partial [Paramuricea clavata]